ncbi:MAG: hypothetical protein AB7C91_02705 [Sphaerochaeta sp.]|jgi:hypothetical protein|uniref:hypothetical protein n=1 Tax=Sphaerochaeta sp. TaxID=1972642 RepID=UPI002FCB294E
MKKKGFATLLVLVVLLAPVGAKTPTANDVTVALAAITDSTICAVAAFLNSPALDLPGSSLHFKANQTLPSILIFQDSDIGTYLEVFQKTKQANLSFFASLLEAAKGPLNDVAIQFLTVHDWQKGQAILKGAAVTEWGEGVSLASLMTTVVTTGRFPSVTVSADVVVQGKRVSTPVRVEGTFMLHSDEDGYFAVEPLTLRINGEGREV